MSFSFLYFINSHHIHYHIHFKLLYSSLLRHEYTENEVIDAIVYRKPIAIKAVYYLIDKRLKQGLGFPDGDYQPSNENENHSHQHHAQQHHHKPMGSAVSTQSHYHHPNILIDNNANIMHTHIPSAPASGIVKQNSQLLPKRHGIQLVARSSSQKNVDFKSIFNNLTMNPGNMSSNTSLVNNHRVNSLSTNLNRELTNETDSPSPDFIAAAMSPIKPFQPTSNQTLNSNTSLHQINSASSTRNTKATNYQDIIQRKQQQQQQVLIAANSNSSLNNANKYLSNDRYYVPINASGNSGSSSLYHHNNRMSPSSEDSYAPVTSVHYHTAETRATSNYTNINPNTRTLTGNHGNGTVAATQATTTTTATAQGTANGNANGMRSLPSSIYRGSPERSLPRSPERMASDNHNSGGAANNYRPTTSRISSSRPSVNDMSITTVYDGSNSQQQQQQQHKYKASNYLGAKRSLTACDDPTHDTSKMKNSASLIKTRQLQMGKAKIELDTQPSKKKSII